MTKHDLRASCERKLRDVAELIRDVEADPEISLDEFGPLVLMRGQLEKCLAEIDRATVEGGPVPFEFHPDAVTD